MAYLMKSGWEHMPQETADKRGGIQGHGLPDGGVCFVVFVAELHLFPVDVDDAMVADGHPVGITADVA